MSSGSNAILCTEDNTKHFSPIRQANNEFIVRKLFFVSADVFKNVSKIYKM